MVTDKTKIKNNVKKQYFLFVIIYGYLLIV